MKLLLFHSSKYCNIFFTAANIALSFLQQQILQYLFYSSKYCNIFFTAANIAISFLQQQILQYLHYSLDISMPVFSFPPSKTAELSENGRSAKINWTKITHCTHACLMHVLQTYDRAVTIDSIGNGFIKDLNLRWLRIPANNTNQCPFRQKNNVLSAT